MRWRGKAGVGPCASWCRAKAAGGGVGSVSAEEVAVWQWEGTKFTKGAVAPGHPHGFPLTTSNTLKG